MNPILKALIAGALAATTLGGGVLGATLVNGTATAQTTPSTTAPAASSDRGSATAPDAGHRGPGGPHSANGITEAVLTGDTATQVKAAVDKALPGSTIERMETDAEGAKYEAHVTKSDGSDVTVKLDANFNVTGTVNGHG